MILCYLQWPFVFLWDKEELTVLLKFQQGKTERYKHKLKDIRIEGIKTVRMDGKDIILK